MKRSNQLAVLESEANRSYVTLSSLSRERGSKKQTTNASIKSVAAMEPMILVTTKKRLTQQQVGGFQYSALVKSSSCNEGK